MMNIITFGGDFVLLVTIDGENRRTIVMVVVL